MCNTFCVSMRAPLIIVLCVALVAARSLGLHSHISHWDDDELAELASMPDHVPHAEHITAPEAAGIADHLAAHVDHGDIDLDEPSLTAGKSQLLKASIALIGLLCILLPAVSRPALRVSQPPDRPPKSRPKPYLFPPSHAPPQAA
ncbi:MAG: hypothetical protein ABL964_07805 [Steroidobacteraceae bacterium]